MNSNMIIDSEAPVSIVSQVWINCYLKDTKVDESDVRKLSCTRRFILGITLYLSEIDMTFLVVLKTLVYD